MMPSTTYTGFSCVVALIVSMQPPWSTATSTITEPGFINLRSSRRTSFGALARSEEHTSELQSPCNLVCRLLLEKKKNHPVASHVQYDHQDYFLSFVAVDSDSLRRLCRVKSTVCHYRLSLDCNLFWNVFVYNVER